MPMREKIMSKLLQPFDAKGLRFKNRIIHQAAYLVRQI